MIFHVDHKCTVSWKDCHTASKTSRGDHFSQGVQLSSTVNNVLGKDYWRECSKDYDRDRRLRHFGTYAGKGQQTPAWSGCNPQGIDTLERWTYAVTWGKEFGQIPQNLNDLIVTIKDDTKSDNYGPKLSIPKIHNAVLYWRTFWEQFQVSIHNRDQLSDSDKLACLNDNLKDGPAEHIFSRACTYGRHLWQGNQVSVKLIWQDVLGIPGSRSWYLDLPFLKEGNGKELRCFRDVALQHYRALKVMNEDSFQTLLTAILELKLDPTTMKDYQYSSQEHNKVPQCSDLLDFIDLQARELKNSWGDVVKKCPQAYPDKKTTKSYMASVEHSCVSCRKDNYPLNGCKTFIALLPEKEWILSGTVVFVQIVWSQDKHFAKQCPSLQKCWVLRHSLLHKDSTTRSSRSR